MSVYRMILFSALVEVILIGRCQSKLFIINRRKMLGNLGKRQSDRAKVSIAIPVNPHLTTTINWADRVGPRVVHKVAHEDAQKGAKFL